MRKPLEVIRDYKELTEKIPQLIKESGLKDKYIFEQIEMSKTNFYRRLNKPELWTYEELEKLFEVIRK